MPLQLQCPNCGKTLKAPEHLVGKRASCPHCRNLVSILPPANVKPKAAASGPPRKPPVLQTAKQPIIQATERPVRQETKSPIPGLAILSGVISIVLGIVCCVIGGIGSIANYLVFSMMNQAMRMAPVAGQAVDYGASYALGVTVFILLFGIALVTASIGLFRGRCWGWILSLILVGVGVIAGGKTYSLYSRIVNELQQHEQMPGIDQTWIEEMRSVLYPTLKLVFLVPTAILFGHAVLTCSLLLMPRVARRYLFG